MDKTLDFTVHELNDDQKKQLLPFAVRKHRGGRITKDQIVVLGYITCDRKVYEELNVLDGTEDLMKQEAQNIYGNDAKISRLIIGNNLSIIPEPVREQRELMIGLSYDVIIYKVILH